MRTRSTTHAAMWRWSLTAFCVVALGASSAHATESSSYAAYFAGKYLTALELAKKEGEAGSKEAFTLMGEVSGAQQAAWRLY